MQIHLQLPSTATHLHGEDRSHQVQRGDENPQLSYEGGQQQSPGGLTVGLPVAKYLTHTHRTLTNGHIFQSKALLVCEREIFNSNPQEGDDVVLGDGLQQSGSARQRLEASAAC